MTTSDKLICLIYTDSRSPQVEMCPHQQMQRGEKEKERVQFPRRGSEVTISIREKGTSEDLQPIYKTMTTLLSNYDKDKSEDLQPCYHMLLMHDPLRG